MESAGDMRSVVTTIEKLELGRNHWMVFAATVLVDASLSALVESPIYLRLKLQDELDIDDAKRAHFVMVAFMAIAAGSTCYSMINTSVGRRSMLLLGLGPACLFTAAQCFAKTYNAFIVLRTLAGLGVGIAVSTAGVYLSEFLPISHRGRLMYAYHFGYSATALVMVLLSGYISMGLFLAITGIPAAAGFGVLIFLPESPRYLAEAGRMQEAVAALRWLSPGALDDDADFAPLTQQEDNPQDYSATGSSSQTPLPPPANAAAAAGTPPASEFWLNLVRVSLPWFCLAAASGGLRYLFPVYISPDKDPLMLIVACTGMDITGNLIAISLADTIDRHIMFIVGMFISAVSSILVLTGVEYTQILFAALQQGAQALPWLSILTLSCELFPTELRGTAAAATRATELIALGSSPVFAGNAAEAKAGKLAIGVYAAIYALGGFLGMYLFRDAPRMVGRPMVESSKYE